MLIIGAFSVRNMIQAGGTILVIVLFAGGACAQAHKAENRAQVAPQAAKISEEKATEIALKEVPGKVTDVSIERKHGKNVYVVEIIEKGSGAEVDVLVDMETGKVAGTER
jgi:uncharacterized membrane protein YkoI